MNNPESILFCGTYETAYWNDEVLNKSNSGIKLFKIELSRYYGSIDSLFKILTPIEILRAQRYRFLKDKNRFIICRGFLKLLLAKETGLHISQIHFEKHNNHKPYFPQDSSLFFNVAHAGNYALIAIGHCDLGVDVEFIDPRFDFNEILPNVFNEAIIKNIKSSENKSHSFYKFWTRKEAIVKAIGKGIDENFLRIPVTDGSHSLSSSLVSDFKKINVFNFNVSDDHIGALAFTEDINNFDKITFYPLPTFDDLTSLSHI